MASETGQPTAPAQTQPPRQVRFASLVIERSAYESLRKPGGALRDREGFDTLARSLADLGQLSPVIAHEVEAGSLHLVDGFARARAMRDLGWESLSCAVIVANTPAERVVELLLTARRDELTASAVTRARLLDLARRMGVAGETIHGSFLPALGLQPHARVLKQCRAVCELPEPVLDFCAEKRFSLKQCVHLTRHSRALLDLVFSWRHRIGLTASLADELLDDLTDYLRGQEQSPADIASHSDIRAVLEAGTTPQRAARQLRDLVRLLRAPVLTQTNQRMDAVRAALRLPRNVRLEWDSSLERRELRLGITLHDPEEWPAALGVLQAEQLELAIAALLEEL